MLPDHQPMPGLARLINKAGDHLDPEVSRLPRLDEAELLEAASRRLSLSDYGDPYFREGLGRLIDSARREAALTFPGRLLLKSAIVSSLENRLKFIDYQKKHPEVFQTALHPPIIVMGLPRSGTTFLHRLLAQDRGNRGLYLWELVRPIPPEGGLDRRRLAARIEYNLFRRLTKSLDHIHVVRDTAHEECIFLLTLTFQSGAFWMMAPVCDYARWCMTADRLKLYEEYRRLLQIFQAQTPNRRLILKAPAHTGGLNEILRFLPNAILVQTHRHPVDVCNSVNSLVYFSHCNTVKRLDVRKIADCDMDMLENEIRRNLFARKYNGVVVHDIFYEEILKDPLGVVKRLYGAVGIPLTPETEAAMTAFIGRNTQHKHGKHQYCAADFGLTDDQIAKRFGAYMAAFGYKPGPSGAP